MVEFIQSKHLDSKLTKFGATAEHRGRGIHLFCIDFPHSKEIELFFFYLSSSKNSFKIKIIVSDFQFMCRGLFKIIIYTQNLRI
jgi:hypothetical protein